MKGSKGVQDYLYHSPSDQYSNYDATITIKNATHVTATLTIYTFNLPQYLGNLFRHSVTYVHVKNTTSIKPTSYAQNSIGKRCKGDELIYFESRNVTNNNRFPSRVFEYSGSKYLTYVRFCFSVRQISLYIECLFYMFNFSHLRQWYSSTQHLLNIMNLQQLFMTWTLNISWPIFLFMD